MALMTATVETIQTDPKEGQVIGLGSYLSMYTQQV